MKVNINKIKIYDRYVWKCYIEIFIILYDDYILIFKIIKNNKIKYILLYERVIIIVVVNVL